MCDVSMCKCFKSAPFHRQLVYIIIMLNILMNINVIGLVCHVLNGLKAPEGLNSFGFCDKKQHVV